MGRMKHPGGALMLGSVLYHRGRLQRVLWAAMPLSMLSTACALPQPGCGAADDNSRVATAHAFTGRMCAASRWEESRRSDSLFTDELSYKLAGREGRAQPMGGWIMVPRTRYGDDFLRRHYANGCRQLVLLGAGMDARAYRMSGMDELRVFEVDQQTTFDVKEPLLLDAQLSVDSRAVVATEFSEQGRWARDLQRAGFDRSVPTVWLLEGLLMYLSAEDTVDLMSHMGSLSARGSAVFHDAVSASYLFQGINVAGAPFIGGSDQYGALWAQHAGFDRTYARDFSSVSVNRRLRRVDIDQRVPEATAQVCRGKNVVLFVEAVKP